MSWTLTVTDLNEYVRKTLAADPMLRQVSLCGEISNFKKHFSGHWYFSMKDEKCRINCVMFRQNNMRVRFSPTDGMKVVLKGTVGIYPEGGSYQFYAEDMRTEGVGDLFAKFEELKKRLLAEGLFDSSRKRPLPLRPRAIGIVTSRTGAVVHDIARVAGRRDPGMQLILRPAQVQGEGAAQDIVKGIEELAQCGLVDVIIIGRGGGSMEDLWAFNEQIVARAIAACPLPVISAVGHETDVTISDFTADARAATPSAAAEIAVPEREVLITGVEAMELSLAEAVRKKLLLCQNKVSGYEKRLHLCHPLARVREAELRRIRCTQRLSRAAESALARVMNRLTVLQGKLDALGPGKALNRGYAIALKENRVLRSVEGVTPGTDTITLLLRDGRMQLLAQEIQKGEPFHGK